MLQFYPTQIDEITEETADIFSLYEPYESGPVIMTQTNSWGCKTLPEDHGFDPAVWDLSDLSDPRLS